jgi:hypothetical protein
MSRYLALSELFYINKGNKDHWVTHIDYLLFATRDGVSI